METSREKIKQLLVWFEKFSKDVYYIRNLKQLKNLMEINIDKNLFIQSNALQRYRQKMYIIYDTQRKLVIDLSFSLKELNYVIFKIPFVKFTYFNEDYQFNYVTRKSKKAKFLEKWKKVSFIDWLNDYENKISKKNI